MKGRTVFGVMVVAIIAGAVFYFVSAPFKTKVDMRVDQATKWTPENIQKDPAGYLTWAADQAKETIDAIEARRIALSQQGSRNQRMIVDKSGESAAAQRLFVKFRDAYKAADTIGSWPTEIDGTFYNQDQLQNQIVMMRNRLDSANQQSRQLVQLQETIVSQIDFLDQKLDETLSTKTDLEHRLEVVRANKAIKNLGDLQTEIAGLTGVADFLAKSETLPTVDSLMEREKTRVTNEQFAQILNAKVE